MTFDKNGDSGTISITINNGNNTQISTSYSGKVSGVSAVSPVTGSRTVTFIISYSNGNGSGTVTFSTSCGSVTTTIALN